MNGPVYDSAMEKDVEGEIKFVEEYYQSLKKTSEKIKQLVAENRFFKSNRKLLQFSKLKRNMPDSQDKLSNNETSSKVIKKILDVFKNKSDVNISEIVSANNKKYIENNKTARKLRRSLKKNVQPHLVTMKNATKNMNEGKSFFLSKIIYFIRYC